MSTLCKQTIMIPFLNNPPFFHYDDAVRGFHSGKTMRDQNARRIFQDEIQCLLDLPFSEWINTGCGFIKDKDGWLLQQDPHQRHELTLSHRETPASFSDFGLDP